MKRHTFFAAAIISAIFTLTGCAGKKELTSTDIAPSSTTATTAGPNAKPVQSNNSGEGVPGTQMSERSIAAEDAAKAGASAESASFGKGKMETVYFDFDAYLLSTEARDTLSRNAALLGESKLARIIIEGHADERGSDDYNLALAEKRAVSAKRYLESLGINAERMEIISYGEDKPAVAGDDEAAWSKNRRVDFVGAQ